MNIFIKLINWYFKKKSLPYWCVIIIDCIIVYGSAFVVYWIFHSGSQTQLHFYSISYVMLLYLIISIITFRLFHTYAGVIRYSSFVDLMRVAYANGTACFIVWFLHYYINKKDYILPQINSTNEIITISKKKNKIKKRKKI